MLENSIDHYIFTRSFLYAYQRHFLHEACTNTWKALSSSADMATEHFAEWA